MNPRISTALVTVAGLALVGTQWYISLTLRELDRRVQGIERLTRAAAPPPLPNEPVLLRGAPVKGQWSAPLALVEFSDFHCPFCRTFARETLTKFEQDYVATGKVLFAFRHLPIEQLHPSAARAARAAACAGEQAQFWAAHDWLFSHDKSDLTELQYAEQFSNLGISKEPFISCMTNKGPTLVTADMESAGRFKVGGTPTFFLGVLQADGTMIPRERIEGAVPIQRLREYIDKALNETVH